MTIPALSSYPLPTTDLPDNRLDWDSIPTGPRFLSTTLRNTS